jgi:hypothetical protein
LKLILITGVVEGDLTNLDIDINELLMSHKIRTPNREKPHTEFTFSLTTNTRKNKTESNEIETAIAARKRCTVHYQYKSTPILVPQCPASAEALSSFNISTSFASMPHLS